MVGRCGFSPTWQRIAAATATVAVLGSACAAAPSQRQADRATTDQAATIVAAITYVPARDEVRIDTIRNEYDVSGTADDLAVIVSASPDVIADLRVGDPVEFSRDDLVGGLETGTIESLPEVSDTDGPDDAEGDDAARIVISAPAVGGAGGMPDGTDVSVVLFGQARTDVTVVSPESVRDDQGQAFVVVEQADGFRRRIDVATGARTSDAVELIGDVAPGQAVIAP